jgi:5-methyltetrahydrofolate--homocysteine methyltransferase
MFEKIADGIVNLKRDEVLEIVETLSDKDHSPIEILEECRKGMTIVGDLFQKGDYYLAELMLSGEIFKQAMLTLEPRLAKNRDDESVGTVLLATLKGDIHDLGKNILGHLLKAQGFEIHDMGIDVPPELVVEKVMEIKPDFVGFSALITPVFEKMKAAEEMLKKEGLRDSFKLMIGGGVTTDATKAYVGADFQTIDAMAGVAYCMKIAQGE